MSSFEPSLLETAVLSRFHELYRAQGFPPLDSIRVVGRENTGGGRYTDLDCDAQLQVDDGYLDLEGGFIEMDGIPNGMMAVVFVQGSRVRNLELTVYRGDFWDGVERAWKIT